MLHSFLWAAAGKQPELEKHVGVGGYGYPALVALNLKKKAYAPLKSAFEREQIMYVSLHSLLFSSCFIRSFNADEIKLHLVFSAIL